MGRPRQVLDEEILEAARACFIEQGAAVSVEVIGARLGVSGPAVLKRFGSKRELLKAAFAMEETPRWVELLEEGPDGREMVEQLREVAGALDDFFREKVPGFAVLREAGIGPEEWASGHAQPPPMRGHLALVGWLTRAQARGQLGAGDVEVMASFLMAGVQYRHFLAHVTGRAVPEEGSGQWLDQMVDTFWRGVAPESKRGAAGQARAPRRRQDAKRHRGD
jgi:AcrR family transcriptional regulator